MPVKSVSKVSKKVSKIEWRLQDPKTGKIYHKVFPTQERAEWHAERFNRSGRLFESPLSTRVVKVRSTYALELVEGKQPLNMKVLDHEAKTVR